MAVRSKRSGLEVYWRDPATGKQRSRMFRTRAEADRENRRVKRLLRYDRTSLIIEDAATGAADAEKRLLSAVAERYVSVNGGDITSQERSMLKFLMGRYGSMDVREVTTETYIDIYEWLRGRGWKLQSIPQPYSALTRLLNFAASAGLIFSKPKPFALPRYSYEEFVPPTPEELSRIYAAAKPHVKRVIILGAGFGMRVGPCELFSLKWSDVDLEHWVIRLRAARKNRREQMRTLPIPDAYKQMFLDWHAADKGGCGYVVHFRGHGVGTIECAFRSALKKAGITRRLRPYDLRHAFATNMLEKGVDIGTVAKLMGHHGTRMITKHYQYVREERKLDALSRLDPIV